MRGVAVLRAQPAVSARLMASRAGKTHDPHGRAVFPVIPFSLYQEAGGVSVSCSLDAVAPTLYPVWRIWGQLPGGHF
ncbi:hypothetical protein EMIT0P44_240019 [Pseudomonas sp. IT-P44]